VLQWCSRRALIALALICTAVALGACGSGSDDSSGDGTTGTASSQAVKVDVGTGTPIEVKSAKPRIAWFGALANLYVQAQAKGMKDEAAREGLDLTVFDAKFDPLVQMQQLQNALQQGKFDAFIVDPFDGNAECPVLSREAPSKGVVVVTAAVTMCDHVKVDEGDDSWTPGTLAQVGYQGAVGPNRQFFREVNKRQDDGKPHVGLLLLGPSLNASSIATAEALKQSQAAGEIPNVDVKYVVDTDFSTADGLARTQTLLQAHPEIDTIMTLYSDVTIGVIQAVRKAGLTGKVKVYDQGASGQSIAAIKAGDLELTTAFHPYGIGVESVRFIADAFAGKRVPRFSGAYAPGEGLNRHLIIDKTNVDTFRPEY
jgi:ribose transport system substrate-binding protein